jgi:hypothetical protein
MKQRTAQEPGFSNSTFYRNLLGWWIACFVIHTAVIYQPGFGLWLTLADSLVSNMLLACCCMLIINNMRFYLPRQEKYWYILVISMVLGGVCLLISKGLLITFSCNNEGYSDFVRSSAGIRYAFNCLLIGCIAMFGLLWYTQKEQSITNRRQSDAEKLARDAELFRLRQQLQPHFLFNSLNSISALTRNEPEKARHMIQQLSDFLRGTLRKDAQQWVPLQEELEDLQLYLDIEKVRFGHRLQTSIQCKEEVCILPVPTLLLQPVVENAIKFGLYDTTETVEIIITARQENDQLIIEVSNPFDPETAVAGKGMGFGLASVQRRLFLLFARNDLVQTTSHQHTFTTTLIIPQIHDKDITDR